MDNGQFSELIRIIKQGEALPSSYLQDDGYYSHRTFPSTDVKSDTLYLRKQDLTTAQFKMLIETLKNNHHIKGLYIQDNFIEDESMEALALTLKDTAINKLGFGSTNKENMAVSEKGFKILGKILSENQLISFALVNHRLSKNALEPLIRIGGLQINKSIISLNFNSCEIPLDWFDWIVSIAKTKPLKALSLGWMDLGNDNVVSLVEALKEKSSVTDLLLERNGINEDGARKIAEAFKSFPLKVLWLGQNAIGNQGAEAIAAAIQNNQVLTELILDEVGVNDEGVKAIVAALQNNPAIATLNFDSNGVIGYEGAVAIASLLSKPSLSGLLLGRNNIGDAGAKFIGKALLKNVGLKLLDMRSNHVGNEGIGAIAEALEHNKDIQLSTLLLMARSQPNDTQNRIDLKGVEALKKALLKNTSLRTLDLSYHRMGDQCVKLLVEALEENSSLITIGLAANGIGVVGATALANALKKNRIVKTIALENNHLYSDDGKGLLALLEALEKNTVVTTLHLEGNQIGVTGTQAIIRMLRENYSLTTFVVRSNNPEVEKTIEQILMRNQLISQYANSVAIHPGLHDYRLELYNFMEEIKQGKVSNLETSQDGFQWIHIAAWYGVIGTIKPLMEARATVLKMLPSSIKKANISPIYLDMAANGYTLLHCAAVNGQAAMIKFLFELSFEHPIEINAQTTDKRQTALHVAVEYGHFEAVQLLFSYGADIYLKDKDGRTAAMVAEVSSNGDTASCSQTKKVFDDIAIWLNEKDMLLACQEGDLKRIQFLHQKKKINFSRVVDSEGKNCLLVAASNGYAEVLKYMLQDFSRINDKDISGNHILHLAVAGTHLETVEYIIKFCHTQGCHLQLVPNNNGLIPLHTAIEHKSLEMVTLLLSEKCLPSQQINMLEFRGKYEGKNLTPLGLAAFEGFEAAISRILSLTKDNQLLKSNRENGDFIHLLVEFNQIPIISSLRTLISNDILFLVKQLNADGLRALSYAIVLNRLEMVKELLKIEGHTQVNMPDVKGTAIKRTPLHWAVHSGNPEMVSFLLQFGVDRQVKDEKGEAAEVLAVRLQAQHSDNREQSIAYSRIRTIFQRQDDTLTLEFNKPVNLVFQGGGVKGIAYVGALEVFQKRFDNAVVERVAGTSAGAIAATLFSLGYSPKEIEAELVKGSVEKFLRLDKVEILNDIKAIQEISFSSVIKKLFNYMSKDMSNPISAFLKGFGTDVRGSIKKTIDNLYQGDGICSGEDFRLWIEEAITRKINQDIAQNKNKEVLQSVFGKKAIEYVTFGELKRLIESGLSYKHIYIIGTALTSQGVEIKIFSSEEDSMKDYIISDIVRISMSIPFIFTPHKIHFKNNEGTRVPYSEQRYIDGGVLKNFPIDIFDRLTYSHKFAGDPNFPIFNPETLGFRFLNEPKQEVEDVNNIFSLARAILSGIYNNEQALENYINTDTTRAIYIDSQQVSSIDFGLSESKKEALVTAGGAAAEAFFKKMRESYNPGEQETFIINTNERCLDASSCVEAASFVSYVVPDSRKMLFLYQRTKEHQNNLTTAVSRKNANDIIFDVGHWDQQVQQHSETGEPIFVYRVYKNEHEVGSASFYKHPLLCRSEAGDRHNIIATTGVLSNFNIETSSIEEICLALPPTTLDRVISSTVRGGTHGAMRGAANVIGYALQAQNVPTNVANYIQKIAYYGGYFILRYQDYVAQEKELDSRGMLNASLKAGADTGSLVAFSFATNLFWNLADRLGQSAQQRGWLNTSKTLKFFGTAGYYGIYAYDACKQGVLEATASIAAGSISQNVVEYTGKQIVNRAQKNKSL